MVRLVIFDIDDTLLDHRAGAMKAMSALRKQLGVFGYLQENCDFSTFTHAYEKRNSILWSQFEAGRVSINDVLEKRFDYLFDWFDIKADHKSEIKKVFWTEYTSGCCLTNDWLPLLQEMKCDFTLIICSNGKEDIQLKKLEKHNILHLFDRCYFGDQHPNCKPNTEFFEKILKDFQVTPEQVIMVGDSVENDILPCQTLGMKTLKYNGKESFLKIHNTLADLKNATKSLA